MCNKSYFVAYEFGETPKMLFNLEDAIDTEYETIDEFDCNGRYIQTYTLDYINEYYTKGKRYIHENY